MKPSEFIIQRLNNLIKPQEISLERNLEDTIFRLILNKKFRKYAIIPSEYLDHISSAIKLNVSKNEPIKLTFVFGGYKLWRLEESPEVDWAELFSFIYYANWLKPICAVYKQGVNLDFYSDDVILEIMDNVPKEKTEAYIKSFRILLEFINPYLPKNLSFTLNRVGDRYNTYEDFKKELKQSIEKAEDELGGLPKLNDEQRGLVELNVRLKTGQADDPAWKEKVFLIHEGYSKVSKRRPYYRTPDKIFIITKQMNNSIAVGTTKTSIVKFWVGAGALKKLDDDFIEYILSPKQLESNKFDVEKISIEGLDGENFKTIRILD